MSMPTAPNGRLPTRRNCWNSTSRSFTAVNRWQRNRSVESMNFDDLEPDALWRYYQRGYHCLVRSGRYFRQILRPALSHVFFLRAMPLLLEYSRANRGQADLPPGFGD